MVIEVTCKKCGYKAVVRLKDVGDAVKLKCSKCGGVNEAK